MKGSSNSCEPCLDFIPENHLLLKAKKLEEEGRQAFDAVMAYQSSQHISRLAKLGLYVLYKYSKECENVLFSVHMFKWM